MSLFMSNTQTLGRCVALILLFATAGPSTLSMVAKNPPGLQKMDKRLRDKAAKPLGRSRVIVRGLSGVTSDELAGIIRGVGGGNRRALRLVGGQVADQIGRASCRERGE